MHNTTLNHGFEHAVTAKEVYLLGVLVLAAELLDDPPEPLVLVLGAVTFLAQSVVKLT